MNTTLLHDLPFASAERAGSDTALTHGGQGMSYAELSTRVQAFAGALVEVGLQRGERVGIYLDKRFEVVIAAFGAAAAGCAFVPLNPLLKSEQIAHILRDCNVRVLVTSAQRAALVESALATCPDLRHVIIVGDAAVATAAQRFALHGWSDLLHAKAAGHRVIDSDMAAILYTSGSTGRPKGVVLSHRNLVMGAKSVASYLENTADDVLLAALPVSFDAGFSQLTTGFHVGARVVLLHYLLPRDLLKTMAAERVTGLTAVPPLYMQLVQLEWPETIATHLRYFANTGGRMPLATLNQLRALLPQSRPYLMYGLTEAFRATYLQPEQVELRPDSIGKAIPNAEVLVLRPDGTRCAAGEEGELVQRGALVALGYWNDPEKTAERFKPLPAGAIANSEGIVAPEIAVFSGDTVRADDEGFLYFLGRRDEMIKTSGYRVSPTEVEEVIYATGLVAEAAAFGVPHPKLGDSIVVVVMASPGKELTPENLLKVCRTRLPLYMVPSQIIVRDAPLPRNANGKIDRKQLAAEFQSLGD